MVSSTLWSTVVRGEPQRTHLLGLLLKLANLQQAVQLLLGLVGQDHQLVDLFVHLVVQCM